jgi:hypothetical protein
MIEQLVLRDDPFDAVHEIFQDTHLERRKLDGAAALHHATERGVQLDIGVADSGIRLAGGATQQGSNAGDELLGLKGLLEVVVCPCVETIDTFDPSASAREDQNRQIPTSVPPPPKHVEPGNRRQTEIKHRSVVGLRIAKQPALVAVACEVRDKSRRGQVGSDPLGERRLIFYDKDTNDVTA